MLLPHYSSFIFLLVACYLVQSSGCCPEEFSSPASAWTAPPGTEMIFPRFRRLLPLGPLGSALRVVSRSWVERGCSCEDTILPFPLGSCMTGGC